MSAPTAATAPKKRRRRWSFVLTALLLGVVLALLLAEAGFRLFWPLPPEFAEFQQAGLYVATEDGEAGLRPGYSGTLQIGSTGVETAIRIDRLGLRGSEIPARSAGQRRVLVVGDSLVFGYGVEAEQALPACLQRELGACGVPAVCGNAGVPTYGSKHVVAHMARLDAPFDADAFVLCGFLGNDAMDDAADDRVVYAGQLLQGSMARLVPVSWRVRLALRSRFALWLERWIFLNHAAWSPLANVPADPAADARVFGYPQPPRDHAGLFLDVADEKTAWAQGAPPVIPRVLATLRTSLERAKKIAGERPLWFVILPTVWQVDEAKRIEQLGKLGFDAASYPRGLAQQRWAAVANELGILVLDATPLLAAEVDAASLFIADGGHFSVRGNELVGRWLAQELAKRLK